MNDFQLELEHTNRRSLARIAARAVRMTLGFEFLSAVADRFGIWGPPGASNIAWGDWQHFLAYTERLNSFWANGWAPALAVVATFLEFVLGSALILGLWREAVAATSAALLASFAVTMTVTLGVKAPPKLFRIYGRLGCSAPLTFAGPSQTAIKESIFRKS